MNYKKKFECTRWRSGPGGSVGIVTGYGLDGPGMESRWGARFSAPVQTGPGAHPASCTMGTGSFPRLKSGRGVTLTPHPLLVPWSWKGRAIPLLPLWALQGCTLLLTYTVEELAEALRYKPHGRLCNWNFSMTQPFWPHYGPGVTHPLTRNQFQEHPSLTAMIISPTLSHQPK